MEPQPPTTSQPNNENESHDLTRRELIQRRASRLGQLTKCYKDHYWLLMEDVRRKHREFIWKYGNNTSSDPQNSVVFANNNNTNNNNHNNHNHNNNNNRNNNDNDNDDVNDERNGGKLGLGLEEELLNRCIWQQCRLKAMALTSYCNFHICKDPNQVLYIGCQFAIRCGGEKPLLCEKPVLRSTVPSLCPHHTRLTETNIRKALKKNGASVSAANKLGSKFHLVLTEYVRLIQSQRRARLVDNNARHDKR